MLVAEIATYLHTQGLGVYDESGLSGNIFVNVLPDAPDEVIMIRPTGGNRSPGARPYDEPTIQIIVRGKQDPRGAMTKADAIYSALHGFHDSQFVTDGAYIVSCMALQGGPASIGQDQNKRSEFSLNFELYVKREA